MKTNYLKTKLTKEDLYDGKKILLDDICKKITEEYDNAVAKQFVLEVANLLHKNGIKVLLNMEQNKDKYKCSELYNISFGTVDTSEHDKQIYNQALEDFFNKCLEENIQFYLNPIDCMRKVKDQLNME